jgi:hypothetical protein
MFIVILLYYNKKCSTIYVQQKNCIYLNFPPSVHFLGIQYIFSENFSTRRKSAAAALSRAHSDSSRAPDASSDSASDLACIPLLSPCPGPFLSIVREPRPSRFSPLCRPVPSHYKGTPAIPLSSPHPLRPEEGESAASRSDRNNRKYEPRSSSTPARNTPPGHGHRPRRAPAPPGTNTPFLVHIVCLLPPFSRPDSLPPDTVRSAKLPRPCGGPPERQTSRPPPQRCRPAGQPPDQPHQNEPPHRRLPPLHQPQDSSLPPPCVGGVDRRDTSATSAPGPSRFSAPVEPALQVSDSPPLTLSTDEEQRLRQFLAEKLPLFDTVRGLTPLAQHEIRLLHPEPVKQRYRPRNPFMQGIIDEEVDKMLAEGVIEPSDSPCSSPIVLAKKKDGKHRFCIDFRKVNEVTRKDAYPLPFINVILDKLRRARYISTIDVKSGYWQVPLTPASKPITAFMVPSRGLYQFRVMPFGLHSAPATFQRLMDRVMGPELDPYCFAYLDDIVVLGETFEQHLEVLQEVFRRLRAANLRLNPDKCQFGRRSLTYLGHVVTAAGIRTDPDKVAAIQQLATPKTLRQLRSFLMMASWYRRFIPLPHRRPAEPTPEER